MKSLAAVALGFFAQVVTYFAVWGIAVVWDPSEDRLADAFIIALAVIGALATVGAIAGARGNARLVAGGLSALFFLIVVMYAKATIDGIRETT